MKFLPAIATLIFTAYAAGPAARFEVATIKRCIVDPGTFAGETSAGRRLINYAAALESHSAFLRAFCKWKKESCNVCTHRGWPGVGSTRILSTIVAKAEGTPGIGTMVAL